MILEPQPKSMVIIGAGAIGVEFAYFYNAFGTRVTLLEMLPSVLPVEDTEVSQTLEKALTKQGIRILTSTKTTRTGTNSKGVSVVVEGKSAETIEADVCLVAIGVAPLLRGSEQAIFLVPTAERREIVAADRWGRGQVERFPGILDRQGALRKVRERDVLMDELTTSACEQLALRCERVDGSRDLDASLALLEAQFRSYLPERLNA